MGGQACVFFGVAEFSSGTDFVLRRTSKNGGR
jgi:hypothetical protein